MRIPPGTFQACGTRRQTHIAAEYHNSSYQRSVDIWQAPSLLDEDDKKTLLSVVRETTDWVESEGQSATLEELEEKLQEVQAVINPITSKLYQGSGGYAADPEDDDQEPFRSHDEL